MTARRDVVNLIALKINEIILDTNSTLDNLFSVIFFHFQVWKELSNYLIIPKKRNTMDIFYALT